MRTLIFVTCSKIVVYHKMAIKLLLLMVLAAATECLIEDSPMVRALMMLRDKARSKRSFPVIAIYGRPQDIEDAAMENELANALSDDDDDSVGLSRDEMDELAQVLSDDEEFADEKRAPVRKKAFTVKRDSNLQKETLAAANNLLEEENKRLQVALLDTLDYVKNGDVDDLAEGYKLTSEVQAIDSKLDELNEGMDVPQGGVTQELLDESSRVEKRSEPEEEGCTAVDEYVDGCHFVEDLINLDKTTRALCNIHQLCYSCGENFGMTPSSCDKQYIRYATSVCRGDFNPLACEIGASVLLNKMKSNHRYNGDAGYNGACGQRCVKELLNPLLEKRK